MFDYAAVPPLRELGAWFGLIGLILALGCDPGPEPGPSPADVALREDMAQADLVDQGPTQMEPPDAAPDASANVDMFAAADMSPAAPDLAVEADMSSGACEPVLGVPEPLPVCATESPCVGMREQDITTASDPPSCQGSRPGTLRFRDGPPRTWEDAGGVTRYACVYTPAEATSSAPRPLLVWLHGGDDDADSAYDGTTLRARAEDVALSGDEAQPGFVLASVQGRNLEWEELSGLSVHAGAPGHQARMLEYLSQFSAR